MCLVFERDRLVMGKVENIRSMAMSKYDPIEFCGELRHESEKAYLVFDGKSEVWIPKSQVQDCHQIGRGNEWEFVIPE